MTRRTLAGRARIVDLNRGYASVWEESRKDSRPHCSTPHPFLVHQTATAVLGELCVRGETVEERAGPPYSGNVGLHLMSVAVRSRSSDSVMPSPSSYYY